MNYTIQYHANRDLSKDMVLRFIREFETNIKKDESYGKELSAWRKIFTEKTGLALKDFDDEQTDEDVIQDNIAKLQKNPKVKEYCLLHFVLSEIKRNPIVLSANAQSFVSMFERRFVGLTGTDWNRKTFHDKIQLKTVFDGVDGEVICNLRKQEPTILYEQASTEADPEKRLKQSLDYIMKEYYPNQGKLHAFIDLGAWGSDVSNQVFAKQFVQCAPSHANRLYLLMKIIKLALYRAKTRMKSLSLVDQTKLKSKRN